MILQELKLRSYQYKSRRGLSEYLAKNHLSKRGYEVFRGTMVLGREWSTNYEKYENVKAKYDRLEGILLRKLGLRLWQLRDELTGGIPDYFAHRSRDDCFFAEIKLEHEQVKQHQLSCMALLEQFGFRVVVLRLKSRPYRLKAEVSLDGDIKENMRLGNREVLVRQEKMRMRW
jgi:hypothetical protein